MPLSDSSSPQRHRQQRFSGTSFRLLLLLLRLYKLIRFHRCMRKLYAAVA
jgi:hypothetical protein